MKVLITGVAGFIGSNLLDALLERKYEVFGIDNLSVGSIENIEHNLANPNFKFIQGDVREMNVFESIDKDVSQIVHLASLKIPKEGHAEETLLNNTQGMHSVLEFARKYGASVIFASTSDVYGKSNQFPFKEDENLVLGSTDISRWSYASSKIFDEHLCFAYQSTFGVPVTVLRYFNSYGPRHNLTWRGGPQSLFIEAILKGREIVIHGDGSQRRCFTYVSDIVDGTILAMEREEAKGEIFNIGNDQTEISIKDLAYLIKDLSGQKGDLKIRYLPHEKLFGKFDEVKRRIPDLSKAKKILGFTPKISLVEGLKRTIEWQKNYYLKKDKVLHMSKG